MKKLREALAIIADIATIAGLVITIDTPRFIVLIFIYTKTTINRD